MYYIVTTNWFLTLEILNDPHIISFKTTIIKSRWHIYYLFDRIRQINTRPLTTKMNEYNDCGLIITFYALISYNIFNCKTKKTNIDNGRLLLHIYYSRFRFVSFSILCDL